MNSDFQPTFDYICHPLKCSKCNQIVSNPCEIDLQTKIARVKELRALQVGDYVDIDPNPKIGGGYLELREFHELNRLTVIEAWSCPNCGANFLWARVFFKDGILESVEPITLDEDGLSSADFLSSEALVFIPMDQILEFKELSPSKLRKRFLKAFVESSVD